MTNVRWPQRRFASLHALGYRLSGGVLGGRFGAAPILLLRTTGRRTRANRVTPLLYVREGDIFTVVASNAGSDRDPGWWHNLQAQPEAEIQVGRQRRSVVARQATPTERALFWPKLVARYRGFADYERRTARTIPVVMLQPR